MTRRTLTISIQRDANTALEGLRSAFSSAWNSGTYQGEQRVYGSPEQLFRVFTPARWGVLEALQAQPAAIGVRPLARQLSRDPTAVLRDLNGLAAEGVVEQDDNGKWLCPFSEIRTDFALIRAA